MFMDTPYITILKILEPKGVGQFTEINPILFTMFPLLNEKEGENIVFQNVSKNITNLLLSIQNENLITIADNQFCMLGGFSSSGRNWLDSIKINASITTQGLSLLASDRNQNMIEQVNKSVVDTNIATKTNFKRQTLISLLTIVIALLTAYISWLTYEKTKSDESQEKRLKTLEENIRTLQQEKKQLQSPKISPTVVYQKKDST
jgi:hypothetical protein